MQNRSTRILVAALLMALIPATASAELATYWQDFELMLPPPGGPNDLTDDGWLVFGNVFDTDGTTYLYGYGPFPAPNDGAAFCAIVEGEGGLDQGLVQLSVYNDYNNGDHALGYFIESNTYQEQTIGAANVGQVWEFSYQAKMGNLEGSSTAKAFIKVLDPNNGYSLTRYIEQDMTTTPVSWQGYTIQIYIPPSHEGHLLQFGFLTTATQTEGSGVVYDNVHFEQGAAVDAPSSSSLGMTLAQNYPNPFNPSTKIEFRLDEPGDVDLAVYDLAGRKVTTLRSGKMDSGQHSVLWTGRTDDGASVASGQYRYVLKTAEGQISRSMILLK